MDNTDKLREISKSIVNFAFENPDNEPILLGIIEQIQSETLEYGKQLGREEVIGEIEKWAEYRFGMYLKDINRKAELVNLLDKLNSLKNPRLTGVSG